MKQITRGLCQLLTIVAEDDSSYINISISKVSVANLQSAFRNKVRWLKSNLHNINKIDLKDILKTRIHKFLSLAFVFILNA